MKFTEFLSESFGAGAAVTDLIYKGVRYGIKYYKSDKATDVVNV